ncbi:MAG TPA: WhiB family transcriptional regulator [Iamia sp.]|nr:WhiB family transcriptional regulator [Iamia sp.]
MSWQEQAACADLPIDVMFPWDDDAPVDAQGPAEAGAALDVCRRCPVRRQCLADALATPGLPQGVRGGLTPAERAPLRPLASGPTSPAPAPQDPSPEPETAAPCDRPIAALRRPRASGVRL